jgi:oxygen-independent coproporphyrinogen-3 oxidase
MVAARAVHPVVVSDVLAATAPRGHRLGLYVHVPFCAQRCHYCSFNTAPLEDASAVVRYVETARHELALMSETPWAGRLTLPTVFFGGGTPSLLAPDDLAALLDTVRARFVLEPDAEITVECNPESVSRDKLSAYRAAGVTRISLGVQTLDDTLLARIGRGHDTRQARDAFAVARAAGFDDVSVDLMYGLPGLDLDGWERTVASVLDWEPSHLSAYGLTLDAGSLWGATGVGGLPTEDAVVAQYWTLARAAGEHGFEHYEISNYARPGFRSRHNQIYWHAEEYLACGPGACGFVGDVRYGNVKPVARWAGLVADDVLPLDTHERLTPRQQLAERLILGLRTADGAAAVALAERTAHDPSLARRLDAWREAGLLEVRADRVCLTEAGFLMSDALFVELL